MLDRECNAAITVPITELLEFVVSAIGPEEPGRVVMQCRAMIIGGSTKSKVKQDAEEPPPPPAVDDEEEEPAVDVGDEDDEWEDIPSDEDEDMLTGLGLDSD